MRQNRRNKSTEGSQYYRIALISFSVLLVAILAFTITFVVYSNYLNNQTDIAEYEITKIAETGENNQIETSQVSSGIGKTINEVKEETEKTNEIKSNTNTKKIAINMSNMQKENENTISQNIVASTTSKPSSKKDEIKNIEKITTNNRNENKKEENNQEPIFKKPVEGEITNEFAKDTLIYSNTLQEWVTHNGVDIKADKTTIVKASAEGTVKAIKNDPRYGITVILNHKNGYSTIYSNLLTAEFIKEGEKVEQGQTIGTVGNTATFEIVDEPHLHFEILKNDEYVNPTQYLK